MKSRISIEVDFDNGNMPVIQILQYPDSPDVRDRLIKNFTELVSGGSWCRIQWKIGGNDHNRIHIQPILPSQLKEEYSKMAEEFETLDKWLKEHANDVTLAK